MRRPRFPRTIALKDESLGRYIPNGLTLLGLCSGATAIRFALTGQWKAAVAAIVLAAILDTLDGRAARLFGVEGAFGAQLDSLADLVSFGIAPSVLVYCWTLYQAGGAGWAAVLVFCACCAIRLARFNIESVKDADEEPERHFTGVPTPAAACLILLPMLLSFQFGSRFFADPLTTAGMIAAMAVLMVSRVPTFSLKRIHVPRHLKAPLMGFAGLLLAAAVIFPWATMTVCLTVYLGTVLVGVTNFAEERRVARRIARGRR